MAFGLICALRTQLNWFNLAAFVRGIKTNRALRFWRGGRAVEGARLESVYTETYRGFEPLPLRQNKKGPCAPWPAHILPGRHLLPGV